MSELASLKVPFWVISESGEFGSGKTTSEILLLGCIQTCHFARQKKRMKARKEGERVTGGLTRGIWASSFFLLNQHRPAMLIHQINCVDLARGLFDQVNATLLRTICIFRSLLEPSALQGFQQSLTLTMDNQLKLGLT